MSSPPEWVTGLGAAFGLLGGAAGGGAFWGGMIGFGIVSAVLYWAREYLLYLVKAGHIAVLVELYDGNDLPAGKSQIDYAQGIVRERFVETSVLFGLDRLIRLVVRAINRMLFTVANFIPIPFLRSLASLATRGDQSVARLHRRADPRLQHARHVRPTPGLRARTR